VIILLVLLSIAVTACGSDDNDTTEASTSPLTTLSAAADLDTAKKLVLVAADLPPGWTAEPDDQTAGAGSDARADELAICTGTSGKASETADWNGDEFSMGTSEVSTDVSMVKDEATFRRDAEAIKGPKVQTCVKDAITKMLSPLGAAPDSVEVTPLEVAEFGDVSVGYRITATLAARGQTQTIYLDLIMIGKNRAQTTTTFSNVGEPFDPTLQRSLIAKVGAKVDAA
jgi:hypothetical protein